MVWQSRVLTRRAHANKAEVGITTHPDAQHGSILQKVDVQVCSRDD
jgi:hypothetical protein